MYISAHSFVSKNKNHCYCSFLCLNFPSPKCDQCAFSSISVKFYEHLDLLSYAARILNMIWYVLQKFVKCYFVRLPRLSYIYWPIYFNLTLKFKFDGCFLFFILIWKMENKTYLNKHLVKLVTIPLSAIRINKYKRIINGFNHQTSHFRK